MRIRASLSLWLIALLSPGPAFACSAFVLKGDTYTVLGFNENGPYLPGMVVVNKRGVRKYNLSLSRLVDGQTSKLELTWTSKYGSVTTTVMGLDLPCYGMNERGLFVVELALKNSYSKPDPARPNMFWGQWIKYQLDNYATVQEVVEHVKSGPVIDWWPEFPKFYGSHFFVSDADTPFSPRHLLACVEACSAPRISTFASSMAVTGIPLPRSVWLIDPQAKTVEILKLQGNRYLVESALAGNGNLTSASFPGWELPLPELFDFRGWF